MKLSSKNGLKFHMTRLHGDGTKDFQCDKCEKAFTTSAQLTSHSKGVHEGIRFPCDQCEKVYIFKPSLQEHVKRAHGGAESYKYECDECGKKFYEKKYVQTHKETLHEGKRAFQCTLCGNSYKRSTGLKNHMNSVHLHLRFTCDHCSKSYTQLAHLKIHLKSEHGLEYQKDSNIPNV